MRFFTIKSLFFLHDLNFRTSVEQVSIHGYFQHYLIRAKYVAGLLKATLLTACQCPPALPSSYDDFVKILFLSGLEDYERDFCGVNKVGNLEVLAELLNLNIRTDGQV